MGSWRRLLGFLVVPAIGACGHTPQLAVPDQLTTVARSGRLPGSTPQTGQTLDVTLPLSASAAAPAPGGPGAAPTADLTSGGDLAPDDLGPDGLGPSEDAPPKSEPVDRPMFAAAESFPTAQPVSGRLLVGLKGSASFKVTATLRPLATMSDIGLSIVAVTAGQEAAATAKLLADPAVEYVERDYRVRDTSLRQAGNAYSALAKERVPNDPAFSRQWGLLKIGAPKAWGVTTGSPAVIIAILDSGIDQDHEDLATKVVGNKNFSDSDTVDDIYGHGTHVAGIAAAITNNRIGVAGTGYNSRLLNVKVMSDDGYSEVSIIAQGIVYAANHGARVLNMSFAGPITSKTLRNAVKYAARKGAIMVASAGNDGTATVNYPAAYPEVIAVGATDGGDQKAPYSSFGASWVDVAAPGSEIYSTGPDHPNVFGIENYGTLSCTSMAAAFVSGEAALLCARRVITPVRWRIEHYTDAVKGKGKSFRYGRINLARAAASF